MYNQDPLFSTLVLDRFFRILSESKYLFSINADGSFVLSMIFFKMIEALRIREIDQMIESFQKDVARPELLTQEAPSPVPSPTPPTPPASIKIQESTPEMNGVVATPTEPQKEEEQQTVIEEPTQPEIKEEDPNFEKFQELVAKIRDRNADLGECFEKQIHFISYKDNKLTWESCADEECKKNLKHGYGVIKLLVREIFGFETVIKGSPCTKEPQQEVVQKKIVEEPQGYQSASTIEDIEAGGAASCVTNCAEASVQDETDGTDITKEPMVQKAIEMFEAKKVTVQSKI
jgi:DNA polymerase-3 subunit gamma/tau